MREEEGGAAWRSNNQMPMLEEGGKTGRGRRQAWNSGRKSARSIYSQAERRVIRETFLTILTQRDTQRRKEKMREERMERKLIESWAQQERMQKLRRLRSFVARLNQRKKSLDSDRALELLEHKLERGREKAQLQLARRSVKPEGQQDADKHRAFTLGKLETVERELERRKATYEAKVERGQKNISTIRESTSKLQQLRKERREKRTLRSKVQYVLAKEAPIVCARFRKVEQRLNAVTEPPDDAAKCMGRSMSQPRLVPDEVLLEHFTDAELDQVKDDLNYFISNKEYREMITIFSTDAVSQPEREPARAEPAGTTRETQYNMESIKTCRKQRDSIRLSSCCTTSRKYLDWVRESSLPRNENDEERREAKAEQLENLKKRQAENAAYEKQKVMMHNHMNIKKREDKYCLAQAGVKAKTEEIRNRIAGMCEREAYARKSSIIRNVETRASCDILKEYVQRMQKQRVRTGEDGEESRKSNPAPRFRSPQIARRRQAEHDRKKEEFARKAFDRKMYQLRLLEQGIFDTLSHAASILRKYQQ